MLNGKNVTWGSIAAGLILLVGAYTAGETLLEKSPIATETYVDKVKSGLDAVNALHENADLVLAADVKTLQKQQLQTSDTLLDGQITAAQIQLIEVNKRLREQPGNPDALAVKRLTENQLEKMQRKQLIVECDILKLERPHASCP
jgi:hypothetical protein